MDNSKGSIILKGLSSSADEGQITAYLEKRAKSIPSEKIPALLKNLPVVLSRNVAATTADLVIDQLEQLGAEAFFIPLQRSQTTAEEPSSSSRPTGTGHDLWLPRAGKSGRLHQLFRRAAGRGKKGRDRSLMATDKELWIILSMLGIAWMLNYTIASQYLLLGFYTMPAVLSAYAFGRRQAVFTAFASILLVGMVSYLNPTRLEQFNLAGLGGNSQWYHIISWGCILIITASAMGTLYEKNKNRVLELRQTYQGLLLILNHFISQNEDNDNHCFRVSIYAARIASCMGLEKETIEDIRSAALLHDIGELQVSRDILSKATHLNREEQPSGRRRMPKQREEAIPDPLRGPLGRILPMLIGHHETFGNQDALTDNELTIPRGARILAVADTYDTLTSDGPGRKAVAPSEARDIIANGSGTEFAPEVVDAFIKAYDRREMKLPGIIL